MPIAINNTKPAEKAETKNTETQAEKKAPVKKAGRPKKNA